MPEDHQKYLEWNGERFRKWAERIGTSTYTVVNAILTSKGVEQQTYRSCMGLLVYCILKIPTIAEGNPESCMRIFPIIADAFGISLRPQQML